jgi:prefoldin subunit 5
MSLREALLPHAPRRLTSCAPCISTKQHNIRWQLRHLPREIADARQTLEHLRADIVTRDTHDGEEFTMAVGQQVFAGKGAREEAAKALARAVFLRRDDYKLRNRASFKGFEILSRDHPTASVPDLFIWGAGTYSAHVNADNPIGTMQSIEHTLRALDRAAADQQQQLQRIDKTLTDYQAQANRPFEHEARLRELLARQAQLNAASTWT